MRDYLASFAYFADLQIEAATLSDEVKAIRDQIMPWAGSKAKVYAFWLHRHSKSGEPLEDIIPIAKFHAENSNRLRGREADINSFKNPGELQRFLEDKFSSKEDDLPEAKPDAVVDGWQLHFPQSVEESCAAAGSKTAWCTARRSGENLFYNYALGGVNLIYATSPDGKKYSLGYQNGELIDGDPGQGGAGYGGVTVNSDNDGISPKEVIPPKVLEHANVLGSQKNKVKDTVKEKLQTPEGIQSLIGDKRYDAARNLIQSIKRKMPEDLSGKEEHIGNLLHEKFLKAVKNFNAEDLNSSVFWSVEQDLSNRVNAIASDSNYEDSFFDIHTSDEKGNLPLDYFYEFPKLTQLNLFRHLRHHIDKYNLSAIPEDRFEKNKSNIDLLNHFNDLAKSDFQSKIKKEITSNPKKHLSHNLSLRDLQDLFGISADYKSSKDIVNILKDKYDPYEFLDTLQDTLSSDFLNFDSRALVEDLPDIVSKLPKEISSHVMSHSMLRDINFKLSKMALENTDVDFKDVKALWDVSAEIQKSPKNYDRENDSLSTNFKNKVLQDVLSTINLERVSPKNQDEIIDIRYSERYVDYKPKGYSWVRPKLPDVYIDENNPHEDEDGNQWLEPFDESKLDNRRTQERLQRQKVDNLIKPEVRQRIKERQNRDREDALAKERLRTTQNTDFYEEEWLDDKLTASFEEFADYLIDDDIGFERYAEFIIEGSEKKVDFLVNQYPKAEKIIRWLASKDPSGQRYKYLNEMWDSARAGAEILEIPLKLRYRLELEKLKSHPIAGDSFQMEDPNLETLKYDYIELSRNVRNYDKKFNTLKENFGSGRAKEIVSQIGHQELLYLGKESLNKLLSVKDSDKVIQDIAIRSIKQGDDRSVEEIIQESKSRKENAKIRDLGDGLIEYLNYDAAAFYRGLDTEWCWAYITSDEMWESYSERGRLFSLDFNGELIGIFLNSQGNLEEIRDAKDKLLTGQKLQNVIELLKTKLPVQSVSAQSTGPGNETPGLSYEEVLRQYELHGAKGEFLRFIKEFPGSGLIRPTENNKFIFTQDQIENSVNDIDKFYNLMDYGGYVLYSFTSDEVRNSIIREFLEGKSLKKVLEEEKMKRFIPNFGDEEKKVLNSKAWKKLNNIFDIGSVINLVQKSSADEVIKVLSYIENHYRKGNLINYNSQKVFDLILRMLNVEPEYIDVEPEEPSTIEEHSEKTYKMYNDSLDDDGTKRLYDPDIALEKDEDDINNHSYDEYIASFEDFAEELLN